MMPRYPCPNRISKPSPDRYAFFNDVESGLDPVIDIRLDTVSNGDGTDPLFMERGRNWQPRSPRNVTENAVEAQSTIILNKVNLDLLNANDIQLHTLRRAHPNDQNIKAEWERRNRPSTFQIISEGMLTAAHHLDAILGMGATSLKPIFNNQFTSQQTSTKAKDETEEESFHMAEFREHQDYSVPVANPRFTSSVFSGASFQTKFAGSSIHSFDGNSHACNSISCSINPGSRSQPIGRSAMEINQPSPSSSSVLKPRLVPVDAPPSLFSKEALNDPSINNREISSLDFLAILQGRLPHATEAKRGRSWIQVSAGQNRIFRGPLKLDPIEVECEAKNESINRTGFEQEEVNSTADSVTTSAELESGDLPYANMTLISAATAIAPVNAAGTRNQYISDAEGDADEEDNVESSILNSEGIPLKNNTQEQGQRSFSEMTQGGRAYSEARFSDADEEDYVFVERQPATDASCHSIRNWNGKARKVADVLLL